MSTLWGREQEWARLRPLLAALRAGRGAVVLLEGEPGIGKSRLVREATAYAADAGCRVYRAQADAMLARRPFALLVEALGVWPDASDPSGTPDASDVPDGGAGPPSGGAAPPVDGGEMAAIAALLAPAARRQPGHEFLVVDRIVDLVERRAAAQPVMLVAEDLQWADDASLRVLHRLVQLTASTPLLVLLSRRPSPVPSALGTLVRASAQQAAVVLRLDPLPPEAARGMAAELAGAPLAGEFAQYVDRAGGNPLYIEGLVEAVGAAESPAAPPPADRLPDSVSEAILRRLDFLDGETLEVLRAATVLGSPFRLMELALVSGRGVPSLVERVRPAAALGLLRAVGDGYAFRHDLVREAVYHAMPEPERAAWHTHAGRVLADAGYDALTVANHLRHGIAPGDPATVDWLARAAAATRPFAPATAAELLDHAAAMAPPATPRRTELQIARLVARTEAGPLPEAVALGEELLAAGLAPPEQARVRRVLAQATMWQGRFAAAAAQLAPLLDGAPGADAAAPAALSVDERRSVAAWHAYLTAWSDPEAASDLVTQVVAEAGPTTPSEVTGPAAEAAAFARLADAIVLMHRGYFAHAAVQARDGGAYLQRQYDRGEPVRVPPPVICQFAARSFGEVRDLLAHPLWAHRPRHQSQRHAMLASMHYLAGEWDDALAVATTVATLAQEQDRPLDRSIVPWVRALVGLGRGELAQVAAALDEAEPLPEFRCLRAGLAYAQGRTAQARALVAEIRPAVLEGPDHLLTIRPLWPVYLPLCLALGERETAEAVVSGVATIAARAGTSATTAEGWHAQGLRDDDPDALVAAAHEYRRTPLAVERAACEEAAGHALARRDHRTDAVAWLRTAAESYGALAAHRHQSRVDAALRTLGVRRGARGRRTRPESGWASLTPTEQRVADLIAQGLIYREIAERLYISRRTVETHVAHIFAKVGVASRAELAAQARQRQQE